MHTIRFYYLNNNYPNFNYTYSVPRQMPLWMLIQNCIHSKAYLSFICDGWNITEFCCLESMWNNSYCTFHLPFKTWLIRSLKEENGNGVRKPREPILKAITGGTLCWNSYKSSYKIYMEKGVVGWLVGWLVKRCLFIATVMSILLNS